MPGADDLAARRLGTILNGKYRLDRLIGEGGMAAVYLATHRNGNRVAIKVLHPHVAADSALRGRFQREGYVANRVDHPGAVLVLDDDLAEDGSVFLVMELLEGETLRSRAQRASGWLPCREVVDFTLDLLSILVAAHAKGIVHRDVKPENLFLTHEGTLKILDFGIARLSWSGEAASVSATASGHLLGTPAFMPPEQVLGRTAQIDGQTDVWAVGATMFWLVSGEYVHPADTGPAMLISAGTHPARSIASVRADVPRPIAAVINRALAFHKAERWASAKAMRDALERARDQAYPMTVAGARDGPGPVSGSRFDASTTAGIEPAAARPKSRRVIWWGVSAASLALAGAVLARPLGGAWSPRASSTPLSAPRDATDPPNPAAIVAERLSPLPAPPEPNQAAPPAASPAVASIAGRAVSSPDAGPVAARTVPTRTPVAPPSSSRRPFGGLHPDCDPPYTVDSMGHRIPRPECL